MNRYSAKHQVPSLQHGLVRLLTTVVFGGLVTFAIPATSSEVEEKSQLPHYSPGISFGSRGVGVTFSSTTNWSLTEGDQIQWRVMVSGIDGDIDDEVEITDIDYKDSESSVYAIQAGVDWYPLQDGWARQVFFSTGLIYEDGDFSGSADMSKSFSVGDIVVNPGDIESLQTDIENRQILPYVSMGWGDKIGPEGGFAFQAEIGLAMSTNDADVEISVIDPEEVLSDAAIAAEEKDIRDDLNGISAFATLNLSYHF